MVNICFCHRLPNRSFFIFGWQTPLCARCLGEVIGAIIGLILIFNNFFLPIILYLLFILPLIIDGFWQLLGYWESTNRIRLLSGILFGIGFSNLSYFLGIGLAKLLLMIL